MRKRSKYRPKRVLANPLGYVIESMIPVAHYESYLVDLKIKNSEAMCSLMNGKATKANIDTLVNMSNMTEVLHEMGFGKEHHNICTDGRFAIFSIVQRAVKHGRFTPTGPEIHMLNSLIELHDAQMNIVTIRDIEKALTIAHRKITHDRNTMKLPSVPEILN